jgi:hypothetical protein
METSKTRDGAVTETGDSLLVRPVLRQQVGDGGRPGGRGRGRGSGGFARVMVAAGTTGAWVRDSQN